MFVSGGHFEKIGVYNGSLLHFNRVHREQMGAYFCIASNDVPPAVSRRISLSINCEYDIHFFCKFSCKIIIYVKYFPEKKHISPF